MRAQPLRAHRTQAVPAGGLGPGAPDLNPGMLYRVDASGERTAIPVGIVPADVVVGFGAVWVANNSGAGVAYNVHSEGPGLPLENSLQRMSNGEVDTIPVENPDA